MFSTILLDNACCTWWICPWWLLWTLGAFLLGALLHWLLFGRGKDNQILALTEEGTGLKTQLTNRDTELASLKYQIDEANKEVSSLRLALNKCESDKAILNAKIDTDGDGAGGAALGFAAGAATRDGDAAAAGEIDYAALLGSDNLQIVEGIGPKIDGLLKEAGIGNWAALGTTSVDRLKEILEAAGSRYRLADPKSWPRQAELAAEGKWDELIEYQKFLDAGVETKGDFDTPSKVEKLITKKLGFSTNPEDLKVVEGIGPKIEGLLKDGGINTWAELAATAEDRLKEILVAAGGRYRLADPGTWAKQAGLAAEGKWDELKKYQDFLDGGKAPS